MPCLMVGDVLTIIQGFFFAACRDTDGRDCPGIGGRRACCGIAYALCTVLSGDPEDGRASINLQTLAI